MIHDEFTGKGTAAWRWRQRNAERDKAQKRAHKAKVRYGLNLDEYDALMEQPCGICGNESQHLDHDHETGEVRGPLCTTCNVGLGAFKDSKDLLSRAILYLHPNEGVEF